MVITSISNRFKQLYLQYKFASVSSLADFSLDFILSVENNDKKLSYRLENRASAL